MYKIHQENMKEEERPDKYKLHIQNYTHYTKKIKEMLREI